MINPYLKPCPFCGGKPYQYVGLEGKITSRIKCDVCGIMTEIGTPSSVVETWNRRVKESIWARCPKCDRPYQKTLDVDVFGKTTRMGWCPECEHVYQIADMGMDPMGIAYEYTRASDTEAEE